jgi:hypothetical protein
MAIHQPSFFRQNQSVYLQYCWSGNALNTGELAKWGGAYVPGAFCITQFCITVFGESTAKIMIKLSNTRHKFCAKLSILLFDFPDFTRPNANSVIWLFPANPPNLDAGTIQLTGFQILPGDELIKNSPGIASRAGFKPGTGFYDTRRNPAIGSPHDPVKTEILIVIGKPDPGSIIED